MTKEEYIQKREELKHALQMLDKQYIESNKDCNIDDIITDWRGTKGVIAGFKVSFNGSIDPIAYIIKKDGTTSANRLYTASGYTVLEQKTTT